MLLLNRSFHPLTEINKKKCTNPNYTTVWTYNIYLFFINSFEIKAKILLGYVQGVSDHHGNSERSHPSRNWCDDRRFLCYCLKIHISYYLGLATGSLDSVDTYTQQTNECIISNSSSNSNGSSSNNQSMRVYFVTKWLNVCTCFCFFN